jgi:hypothetical protein
MLNLQRWPFWSIIAVESKADEVNDMAKDYSVQGTTKLQREKYVSDAIALSTLDALEPSEETMTLMRDYVDGKREIAEVLQMTIERYRIAHA